MTIQYIKADVSTICVGMAQHGSCCWRRTKGKRYARPTRIMIHQPMGGAAGERDRIQAEILFLKKLGTKSA